MSVTELFLLLKSHLQQGASHTSVGTPGLCDIRCACECVCMYTCCFLCRCVCTSASGVLLQWEEPQRASCVNRLFVTTSNSFSKFVCFSLFFPSLPFIYGLDLGLRRLSVAVRSLCVCASWLMHHCPRCAQAPHPPLCPAVAGTPAANLNRYVKSAGVHRLSHPASNVLRVQKTCSVQKIMFNLQRQYFSSMSKRKQNTNTRKLTKIHRR